MGTDLILAAARDETPLVVVFSCLGVMAVVLLALLVLAMVSTDDS